MTAFLIGLFENIPSQISTLLMAMLPVVELRGSIPIALGIYKLSILESLIYSVIGNIIPVIIILIFFDPISKYLRIKFKTIDRFFSWLFEKTRKRHTKNFERWGAITLITLVAIPLPLTGGYTGALAAYLFGIPFRKALPLILLGIIIAGIIVTLLTTGIYKII